MRPLRDAGERTVLTFAILDERKGIPDVPPTADDEYPLPAWYRAVRHIPIEELTTEDICRACRQQIHLEYVVPTALRMLQSDPLAGEQYDGELFASLRSVPSTYWPNHADEAAFLKVVAERILGIEETDKEVAGDARELRSRLP